MTKNDLKLVKIDATDMTLGRLCAQASSKLQGKHLVDWQPNKFSGVQVVIMNVAKLRFTGNKLSGKLYHSFSGYPGGIKTTTLGYRFTKNPTALVRNVIKHMLPKNRLNARWLKNLKIYRTEVK